MLRSCLCEMALHDTVLLIIRYPHWPRFKALLELKHFKEDIVKKTSNELIKHVGREQFPDNLKLNMKIFMVDTYAAQQNELYRLQ